MHSSTGHDQSPQGACKCDIRKNQSRTNCEHWAGYKFGKNSIEIFLSKITRWFPRIPCSWSPCIPVENTPRFSILFPVWCHSPWVVYRCATSTSPQVTKREDLGLKFGELVKTMLMAASSLMTSTPALVQYVKWLEWWHTQRHFMFRAFSSIDAPNSNLAEVIHAGDSRDFFLPTGTHGIYFIIDSMDPRGLTVFFLPTGIHGI